jgi:hypothetical protein
MSRSMPDRMHRPMRVPMRGPTRPSFDDALAARSGCKNF